MASGRNVIFYVAKGAQPELAKTVWNTKKNSELAKQLAVFSFTWYYWLKWGWNLNNSDKKKPLLSGALTGDDNKGFASANADEHNDRITRFATLKHRAKNQENYLFTTLTKLIF